MRRNEKHIAWLNQSSWRKAIVESLTKPVTQREIIERVVSSGPKTSAPKMELRDVWFHLRQLRKRKLTVCLTPRLSSGKIYYLTMRGCREEEKAWNRTAPPLPRGIDWNRYALVLRAKVRLAILKQIAEDAARFPLGRTAKEIRRSIRESDRVGMDGTLRALRELVRLKLVRAMPSPRNRRSKLYLTEPMGQRIANQLNL